MGIRDWFRGKPKGPETVSMRPRPRYYAMPHILLRQVGLEDPLFYLGVLASPDAPKFLSQLMVTLDENDFEQDDFDVGTLRIHPVRIGQYPCAVVEFPQPRGITEVFYTALVALIDPANGIPEERTEVPARYFTLELGLSDDESQRTVLCEWNATTHANFGDGPEPTVAAFVAEIEKMLEPSDPAD
jgi:hypothetical protein